MRYNIKINDSLALTFKDEIFKYNSSSWHLIYYSRLINYNKFGFSIEITK